MKCNKASDNAYSSDNSHPQAVVEHRLGGVVVDGYPICPRIFARERHR
jgi:hypothetical protein